MVNVPILQCIKFFVYLVNEMYIFNWVVTWLDIKLTGLKLKQEGSLHREHVAAWYHLWNSGRIEVAGNLSFARMVAASQYYILSSLPTEEDPLWPFCGISPNGLPWGAEEDVCTHTKCSLTKYVPVNNACTCRAFSLQSQDEDFF